MKRLYLSLFAFALVLLSFAQTATTRVQGNATQLIVDGKPFIILGGELGNSSASCDADIERIFPRLHQMGLNTVLTPMYWDLFEPIEGQYDYSLTDKVLQEARANDLRVVFLWFGAWKNSMSCYAPTWFKTDYKKYPRAHTKAGKPLEIASAFSENVFKADNRAFTTWLKHLKEVDQQGTVIMIQIENEIGMLEDARDYSADANKLFKANVPADLAKFLKRPAVDAQKSWTEVFGEGIYTDEIFQAYYYAKYVERMAQTAKSIFDVPLYVNAAMNSRGRKPGQYPSAGPLAHLKDIWHCAAPSLAWLSPDIYDSGFTSWVKQYSLPDNQLFIPEIQRSEANGAQAFFVIGEHNAVGISPFSIENATDGPTYKPTMAYKKLSEMMPLINQYVGNGTMRGLYFDKDSTEKIFSEEGIKITARHFFTLPWDARATDGSPWPAAGAILIKVAPLEYVLAGSGVVVQFENEGEKLIQKKLGEDGFTLNEKESDNEDSVKWSGSKRIGIAYCDEVEVNPDGSFKYLRRLNGDQDHQGRHIRIGVDDFQILHVKLYEYK